MTSSDCSVDPAALAALRREVLDWRCKAIPSSLWGVSLADAAKQRLSLFDGGFLAPVVTIDAESLEHNLVTMAAWCAEHGVRLAPHGKTTMAPQLFARQIEHGAWGFTAANASQLRIFRAFGISRVMLANQLVDPAALRWLTAELERDPGFEFSCWADSVRSVELMTETLRGAAKQVDILVELGGDGGRTGARDEATALAIAEAVRASPALRLVGVSGYEGAFGHDRSAHSEQAVGDYLRRLRALTITLAEHGFFTGQIIVTAGGSAYFDQVAAELTGWPDGFDVLTVLRSGAYVTHDDGFYRGISPLRHRLRPALRAWAQVTSKPASDLALLTIGKRDASFDEGLPEPHLFRRDGITRRLDGHTVTAMNDQHSFLELPSGSPLEVGDWVGLGLSHPCTVFDKWQLIPVVDGDTVVDFVHTYF
ncbi:amino acid deaminase [Amycolatopsis pithecellobii]|uniref:Amino acid deaminase n=1 Tax=Amycolatopsis pithecellobii TaxID=664692 RepID=A0A6N7Z7Y6_9PSEU|nr:amino acid deaminase [Amycolatopsis pithecellobii]MTD57380.1 amino acid deaminase [Amycolatopsis pithecellobii]